MDFEYTDARRVLDSSAVSNIYHNSETNRLGITFTSGGTYVYDGVPVQVFKALSLARSKGEAVSVIKQNHTALGEASEVFKKGSPRSQVSRPVAVAQTARPSWERPRDASGRFLRRDGSGSVAAPVVTLPGTFVPNGVRVALGGNNGTSNPASSNVQVSVPTGVKRKYEVHFSTNGLDNVYKTEAGSETEAVQHLTDAAAALNVEAKVRKVVSLY